MRTKQMNTLELDTNTTYCFIIIYLFKNEIVQDEILV